MNIKELKELLKLLKDSGVTEFEMEREGVIVKINRNVPSIVPSMNVPPQFTTQKIIEPPVPASASPLTREEEPAEPMESMEGVHIVHSPIVGTFYRCPNPNAKPYIEIGDRVKSGQILCIVEAMKLMNEITTEVSGEILKIFVENAQPVEYGEPLFAIKTN